MKLCCNWYRVVNMLFDRLHFNSEERYIDLHIPRRTEEELYFLLGRREFIIYTPFFTVWYLNGELMLFR